MHTGMERMARQTAIAYITHGDRLLVFRHTQFPEAGIQVPAGTVEPGESPLDAVLREVEEESGLKDVEVCAFLGECKFDLSPYGRDMVEKRYYFHLKCLTKVPETWLHYEMYPSDGSPAPIEFEFYWVQFPEQVPELSGGQGEFLSSLSASDCVQFPAVMRRRSPHARAARR